MNLCRPSIRGWQNLSCGIGMPVQSQGRQNVNETAGSPYKRARSMQSRAQKHAVPRSAFTASRLYLHTADAQAHSARRATARRTCIDEDEELVKMSLVARDRSFLGEAAVLDELREGVERHAKDVGGAREGGVRGEGAVHKPQVLQHHAFRVLDRCSTDAALVVLADELVGLVARHRHAPVGLEHLKQALLRVVKVSRVAVPSTRQPDGLQQVPRVLDRLLLLGADGAHRLRLLVEHKPHAAQVLCVVREGAPLPRQTLQLRERRSRASTQRAVTHVEAVGGVEHLRAEHTGISTFQEDCPHIARCEERPGARTLSMAMVELGQYGVLCLE
eukprot:6193182-Pleurochrysis_carterae.AAC.4